MKYSVSTRNCVCGELREERLWSKLKEANTEATLFSLLLPAGFLATLAVWLYGGQGRSVLHFGPG